MAKLSKAQIKAHKQACEYLAQPVLSYDEREFVLENWQESATHINSAAGAFFTPLALAWDFSIEARIYNRKFSIIDLCAGIGVLGFAIYHRNEGNAEIVCIEKNPDYVSVGQKVMPEATWICADVFEATELGRFDFAVSNPPFGRGGPIKGVTLDLNVVAVASKLADFGVFILPSGSVPFKLSGQRGFSIADNSAYRGFHEKTGITLGPGCGIDCDYHRDKWKGVSPSVEIALAEFEAPVTAAVVAHSNQFDLFSMAAE